MDNRIVSHHKHTNYPGAPAANRLTVALLLIYLLILCWILLLKLGVRFSYMESRSVNLTPFREIALRQIKTDVPQLLLNVAAFAPLGVYAGILFYRWPFTQKLFLFFLTSFVIESLQYAMAIGAFDSTDMVTNTAGGVVGHLLFKAAEKAFGSRTRAQTFINRAAGVATALLLLFLALLKLNLLPLRYQ